MYDVWCMMYDVWCMMYDVWCIMYDVWYMMYDVSVIPHSSPRHTKSIILLFGLVFTRLVQCMLRLSFDGHIHSPLIRWFTVNQLGLLTRVCVALWVYRVVFPNTFSETFKMRYQILVCFIPLALSRIMIGLHAPVLVQNSYNHWMALLPTHSTLEDCISYSAGAATVHYGARNILRIHSDQYTHTLPIPQEKCSYSHIQTIFIGTFNCIGVRITVKFWRAKPMSKKRNQIWLKPKGNILPPSGVWKCVCVFVLCVYVCVCVFVCMCVCVCVFVWEAAVCSSNNTNTHVAAVLQEDARPRNQ